VLPEFMASLTVIGVTMIISLGIIIKGKSLRQNKNSIGPSASSNNTSISTSLMVCGLLLFLTQVFKLIELIA